MNEKTNLSTERASNATHDTAYPVDVKPSDRVITHIRISGSQSNFTTASTTKISPLGIEATLPQASAYDKGAKVDLEVVIGGKRSPLSGVIVDSIPLDNKTLLHIRFLSRAAKSPSEEKRKDIRWLCSEDYLPIAFAPVPGRFKEFTWFQVRNISSSGLQLFCSLTNKFLVPGMDLRINVRFPMVGDSLIRIRIARVRIAVDGTKEVLDVGAEMVELDKASKSMIGQYLLQFSDIDDPEALQNEGFGLNEKILGVRYFFLRSQEDYTAVLKLRSRVSNAPNEPLFSHIDPKDQLARVIVAQVRNLSLAAALLVFSIEEVEDAEYKDLLSLPALPRRDQILTLLNLQFDPTVDSKYLLIGLLKYVCTTCVTQEKPYLLVCLPKKYTQIMAKLGWKQVDWTNSAGDAAMVGNAYDALVGVGANPIYWNFIWREVSDYMIETKAFNPVGIQRAMLTIYRCFSPLSYVFFATRDLIARFK